MELKKMRKKENDDEIGKKKEKIEKNGKEKE